MDISGVSSEGSAVFVKSCENGYVGLWHHFGQCVHTSQQVAGFVCGILSTLVLMAAHLCLLALRYNQHSQGPPFPHRGLSFLQVFYQAASDVCGCLGALFTHQLGTQIVTGLYSVCADMIFILQWLVLQIIRDHPWMVCLSRNYRKRIERLKKLKKKRPAVRWGRLVPMLTLPLALSFGLTIHRYQMQGRASWGHIAWVGKGTSRTLMAVTQVNPTHNPYHGYSVGYWLGVVAGIMDILFVLPKVCRMLREHVLTRLHLVHYSLCIVAHGLYVLGVYTQEISTVLLLHTLPWTAPRIALMGFYIGMLIQHTWNQKQKSKKNVLADEVLGLLGGQWPEDLVGAEEGCREEWSQRMVEEKVLWVPLKNMNNSYLAKMSQIVKSLDTESEDADGEDMVYSKEPLYTPAECAKLDRKFPKAHLCSVGSDTESHESDTLQSPAKSQSKLEWCYDDVTPVTLDDDLVDQILDEEDKATSSSKSSREVIHAKLLQLLGSPVDQTPEDKDVKDQTALGTTYNRIISPYFLSFDGVPDDDEFLSENVSRSQDDQSERLSKSINKVPAENSSVVWFEEVDLDTEDSDDHPSETESAQDLDVQN